LKAPLFGMLRAVTMALISISPPSVAQENSLTIRNTVKQCLDDWRANRAEAKGHHEEGVRCAFPRRLCASPCRDARGCTGDDSRDSEDCDRALVKEAATLPGAGDQSRNEEGCDQALAKGPPPATLSGAGDHSRHDEGCDGYAYRRGRV
jgi:hypothetical protein